ncbi:E3 ubiquitin-protein ligase rnf8-B-like [Saccostrea echinata]|uniref:E3 ubiquitin-protein ligase rnf8-B-like n=1 Tax=Saccostrea echinata TaxID=191078 RepID=UPI002A830C2E|nr:E3 ubiquitin-protein ligase rnf8-B-like [Saccostrea echinata]
MATGYDERYARQLHDQSLESEIIRGISEFPTDSVRNDPDAFLAWQLQNQEYEKEKKKDRIHFGQMNSVSPSIHRKNDRRKDKNRIENGNRDHPVLIIDSDSDTECDAPHMCPMDTDELKTYSDNQKGFGANVEETFPKDSSDNMMDTSYQSVTEKGSVLAQPQSEDIDSSGRSTFTFYSDDVEEDSIPEVSSYDEDVSSPKLRTFQSGLPSPQVKDFDELPNPHQVNGYRSNPQGMKGSRRSRKWPKNSYKQNNHYEHTGNYIYNDTRHYDHQDSSDDETQPKQRQLDTFNHIPNRTEKNFRRAQKKYYCGQSETQDDELRRAQKKYYRGQSETQDDELFARRLGQELNRTQVERDGEMARRLQEEEDEKNNLLREERNFLDRRMQQRNHPNLQMHDPYENRAIRHRTPFQLHRMPEGLLLLQSILGMEGQILPPHLMQGNVDLNDYEALWELAERIGDAKGSGITEEALQSLCTTQFQSQTADTNDVNECRICISDFDDGDTITSLPCNHRFHKHCIETWLKRKAVCPICRKDILDGDKN